MLVVQRVQVEKGGASAKTVSASGAKGGVLKGEASKGASGAKGRASKGGAPKSVSAKGAKSGAASGAKSVSTKSGAAIGAKFAKKGAASGVKEYKFMRDEEAARQVMQKDMEEEERRRLAAIISELQALKEARVQHNVDLSSVSHDSASLEATVKFQSHPRPTIIEAKIEESQAPPLNPTTLYNDPTYEIKRPLIQHMESVKKSIDERVQHKTECDNWVNKRPMQTTKEKVDTSKALDASLVDTESSRTESKEQDTSSRSGNDAHADDADIRPIYDEEPMAEVQTTAEINVFATGQHHTEQPEFNNE
nr:hypothetical protein [Tanacetum cinerariifolium]